MALSRAATTLTSRTPRVRAVQTPYEGGIFKLKLVLGAEYPAAPPKGAPRAVAPTAEEPDVPI
jgi:hypothetical protein